jgi:hypothetical protein
VPQVETLTISAIAPSIPEAEAEAPPPGALGVAEPAAREPTPTNREPSVVGLEPQPVPAPMVSVLPSPRTAPEPANVEVRIGRVEIEVRQPKERRVRAVAPSARSAPSPGRFDGIAAARRLQDRRWY